jgi:metallo-beta-lactamase family protein
LEYDIPVKITEDVEAIFTNAGHLIGSASIFLTVRENGNKTGIVFSGDVGRYRSTLLQPPSAFNQADYIILESTYGNSFAPAWAKFDRTRLLKCIKKTCIQKRGKLIIPAF